MNISKSKASQTSLLLNTVKLTPRSKTILCLSLAFAAFSQAWSTTPVLVEDFEKPTNPATVGVVNIPNENASVSLSTDHPAQGKQSLKLHYHFTGGNGQYLVVPFPATIKAPVHKLDFMLYGDNSGCSYGIYLTDASGQTHKIHNNEMKIDFSGWKEMIMDLDLPHETWGGDKSGKMELPITGITFEIGNPGKEMNSDLYFDNVVVDSDKSVAETTGGDISVLSPEYCSDVQGDAKVSISGTGYKSVTVKCWKQGPGFGADSTVATVSLDENGNGSFVFPADSYPHGPNTIRISGSNDALWDNCYLQVYNKGGVHWNEGMPKDPPPPAAGMHVVFADDFSGPLSISSNDPKALYYAHKPPNGSQDFSSIPFTDYNSPNNPFAQMDTYLRIRTYAKKNSSGLISSENNDAAGFSVTAPCYFECRFIGPNAKGTWPAFWLLSDNMIKPVKDAGCDELDIIEAYGGEGPKEPNPTGEARTGDLYQITPHAWNQGDALAQEATKMHDDMPNPADMAKHGIPSSWWESMHTYGCKITPTDTIYYCDNIEMGRHKTLPVSQKAPFFFLINMATGGGWPVDLSRYNGKVDMYVDYVRVWAGDGAQVRGGRQQ